MWLLKVVAWSYYSLLLSALYCFLVWFVLLNQAKYTVSQLLFKCVFHFFAVFKRGDVLSIIRKTADGWWLAQDTQGNRGVVPKNYLKVAEFQKFDILTSLKSLFRLWILKYSLLWWLLKLAFTFYNIKYKQSQVFLVVFLLSYIFITLNTISKNDTKSQITFRSTLV